MKKLKIYLDTSVISHLQSDDVPEKMDITKSLWQMIQKGKYKACLSELVLQELSRCDESKNGLLKIYLADIDFETYFINDETKELASLYIQTGAFTDKHLEDALHVACAVFNNCNAVVSWNFKHIVKLTVILLVNGVNKQMGYKEIEIVSPEVLVGEEE